MLLVTLCVATLGGLTPLQRASWQADPFIGSTCRTRTTENVRGDQAVEGSGLISDDLRLDLGRELEVR